MNLLIGLKRRPSTRIEAFHFIPILIAQARNAFLEGIRNAIVGSDHGSMLVGSNGTDLNAPFNHLGFRITKEPKVVPKLHLRNNRSRSVNCIRSIENMRSMMSSNLPKTKSETYIAVSSW